jgi:hypothetical protein
LIKVGGFNEAFTIYGMEDIELGYRLERAGSRMMFAPDAAAVHFRLPTYEDFMERSEQAGYCLGYLLSLHPELKGRFVESGRITRHLKGLHPLYRGLALALTPLINVLTFFEKQRGTGRISSTLDMHYAWSVRYHFFLGYRRYLNDHSNRPAAVIRPSLEMSESE